MNAVLSEVAATTQGKIQEMVRRIVERFDPEKVILFGSHARGTAGPDSDVDLLVIKRVVGSKRKERLEIRAALRGIGLAKDVVLATPEEMEKYRDLVGTIIHPAMREGKVLYFRSLPGGGHGPARPEGDQKASSERDAPELKGSAAKQGDRMVLIGGQSDAEEL
ncbi:MAG: nucleotidyltransferase domain-containing protein [Candidatus Latescibacteria bacterium]|nr:nucleotidyltransferase domain-containing protein [Candidatus Latescibacterota bacterium]